MNPIIAISVVEKKNFGCQLVRVNRLKPSVEPHYQHSISGRSDPFHFPKTKHLVYLTELKSWNKVFWLLIL